jgi:hypothetical protein
MVSREFSAFAVNPYAGLSRYICIRISSREVNRQRPVHSVRGLTIERFILMKNSSKSLVLAAACAGLLGGTAVRMNAQPTGSPMAHAGVMIAQDAPAPAKHACKGKNDCKGQGGGKNAGKNACKGKGNCATDGSKAPKA